MGSVFDPAGPGSRGRRCPGDGQRDPVRAGRRPAARRSISVARWRRGVRDDV